MGATLVYAKVVDRDHFQEHGGLSPGTDNKVLLTGEPPATARDFLVLRKWKDIDGGGFDEHWRIEDPHGHVIYVGAPRTVLADDELGDEVQGVRFDADSTCVLVLEVDGREVARADVEVAVAGGDTVTVPRTAGAEPTRSEGSSGA